MDISIIMKSIVLSAHQLVQHVNQLQPVSLALLTATEFSKEMSAFVSLDTINCITLINREHAKNVIMNVSLAMYLPQTASLVIQPKIEFLELINMEIQLVYVILVSFQLRTDLVFSQTVMLIPSALNANSDSNSAFNVLPLKTESSNFLKVFVYAWTDSTQTSIIIVFLV